MPTAPLSFHLERYEGPLDLLLDLIRKQQINIYDIPIAQITSQYMAYMEKAAQLDIELSAEFVYMAATLIHIKSKMLLPRDPELEKILPEDDPRQELVDRLLEHERFKNAAEMLQQKRMIEEAVWSTSQLQQFAEDEDQPGLSVTLFDLVKTLQDVLERARSRPTYAIEKEDVGVPDMIRVLHRVFREERRIPALQLFEQQRSRRAIVCLFLAILELVKRQALLLVQQELFGEIGLEKTAAFEASFTPEGDLAAFQEDYT
ncbi:MAG: chromosome segregation protein ScpA [Acidobacteria bacterium]|nr:chromosome segregation protein ScpA [Acidobacteriota bacterium]